MKTLVLAGTGGALAALVVWAFARRSLDNALAQGGAQLRRKLAEGGGDLEARMRQARVDLKNQLKAQINQQVPPVVAESIQRSLARYGITPATGRQVALVLAAAERAGLV